MWVNAFFTDVNKKALRGMHTGARGSRLRAAAPGAGVGPELH